MDIWLVRYNAAQERKKGAGSDQLINKEIKLSFHSSQNVAGVEIREAPKGKDRKGAETGRWLETMDFVQIRTVPSPQKKRMGDEVPVILPGH